LASKTNYKSRINARIPLRCDEAKEHIDV
jgi:hypothetical protein